MAAGPPAGADAPAGDAPLAGFESITIAGAGAEERPIRQLREAGPASSQGSAPNAAPATKAASALLNGASTQATPEPAKGPSLGVMIATAPTLDAARLTWQALLDGHRTALSGLEPRYVEAAGETPTYRLIAGPVKSREAAARLCERLKLGKSRCHAAPFAGHPL